MTLPARDKIIATLGTLLGAAVDAVLNDTLQRRHVQVQLHAPPMVHRNIDKLLRREGSAEL